MILLGHKGEGLPISSAYERCHEEDVRIGASPHLYEKCRVAWPLGSTGYNGLCFMWWLYDYCTGVSIEPWVVGDVKKKFLPNPCEYMVEPLFCKYNFHIIAIDLTGLEVVFFEDTDEVSSRLESQNPTLRHRFW